ncbi:hypothetical protein [Pseudomonas sp. LP_7_YM]|uniref:hypothetical protein n=1 Tax=Pseudomonas sp. LP_7_YM TaxID=2485137 RepID=UPI0010610A50|nr:hypothetical protein [Pseudomonas sp. LP_7_YM]TDV60108.1 hypothetical protein EC915_11373 [Pseudomonas sp. LP_7_YM]
MLSTEHVEWPDEFTREEMLEQQSRLLIQECHMLQKDLSRYRQNQAKLIDMHNEVTLERDKLRIALKETEARLSDCLRENASMGNRIGGLENSRQQLEDLHEALRIEAMKKQRSTLGRS